MSTWNKILETIVHTLGILMLGLIINLVVNLAFGLGPLTFDLISVTIVLLWVAIEKYSSLSKEENISTKE